MINPAPIERRWSGPVVVAAPGPSLTAEIADVCRALPCIAVNDAYRLLPWAEVLYAADIRWWDVHKGCSGFGGIKIAPNSSRVKTHMHLVKQYGLRLVEGESKAAFSLDPRRICYGVLGTGANSGLQAINLAILFGGNPIVLVGFDMREVGGKPHFFGQHPRALVSRQNFQGWVQNVSEAARKLPPHIKIINATPGSALKCFPVMSLAEAIDGAKVNHAA